MSFMMGLPTLNLLAIDVFSGVGGLSEGLYQAGFKTALAFELDEIAATAYKLNHPDTEVIVDDIRNVSVDEIKKKLNGKTIHLLAGCPPCQGFSSVRRLNKVAPVEDARNSLIEDFVNLIEKLLPFTIMMENVPGLINYELFHECVKRLVALGYKIDYKIVNVRDYGVPQSRKRLVLVGSRLGRIKVAKGKLKKKTVRQTIEKLAKPAKSKDPLHKIFPVHGIKVQERIENTPLNGGSRKDLPERFTLKCHKAKNVGFNDIYGRLRWDDVSTTITGGCLNPSKGRFLHPEQHRCISAREAALLQSFPPKYKFPANAKKDRLALMIGNALPPKFSKIQSRNIKNHLKKHVNKIIAETIIFSNDSI